MVIGKIMGHSNPNKSFVIRVLFFVFPRLENELESSNHLNAYTAFVDETSIVAGPTSTLDLQVPYLNN